MVNICNRENFCKVTASVILVMENHCPDNMNRNKALLISLLAANKYSILVLSVVQKGGFSRSHIPKNTE